MNIVQGDLLKALETQLTLGESPFPLVGGDVLVLRYWRDRPERGGSPTEVTPVVVDGPTGQIKYEFVAGQTDVTGTYYGRVTVTRSSEPITFPDDGTYFQWTIHP